MDTFKVNDNSISFYIDGLARSSTHFLTYILKSAYPDSFGTLYRDPPHSLDNIVNSKFTDDATVIAIRSPIDAIISHLNMQTYQSNEEIDDQDIINKINTSNEFLYYYLDNIKDLNIFDFNFITKNGEKIPDILYNRYKFKTKPIVIDIEDAKKYIYKNAPKWPDKVPGAIHKIYEFHPYKINKEDVRHRINTKFNKESESCIKLYKEVIKKNEDFYNDFN